MVKDVYEFSINLSLQLYIWPGSEILHWITQLEKCPVTACYSETASTQLYTISSSLNNSEAEVRNAGKIPRPCDYTSDLVWLLNGGYMEL